MIILVLEYRNRFIRVGDICFWVVGAEFARIFIF